MKALDVTGLEALFEVLASRGYRVVGPSVRDGAVVLDELRSPEALPRGVSDRQAPGVYRLETCGAGDAVFAHRPGAQSWKRLLFPPRQRLFRVRRDEQGELTWQAEPPPEQPRTFFGVRPCDLAAIEIQDRVFLGGDHPDPHYRARRENAFLVVAQCTESGGTCFCASLGTGPWAKSGFDLALTELPVDDPEVGERLLVQVGSPRGEEVLAEVLTRVTHREATEKEEATARKLAERAARTQQRGLPAEVREALSAHLEHPRWDEVAQRCLSCGNCTLVCPTCFCSSVEDTTDLERRTAERRRLWDSCFTVRHSYLHGGPVRSSTRSRYRQWLTHKLATWWDQFDTSGCVGCGRCITWCPVGIDITEEARAIASGEEVSSP